MLSDVTIPREVANSIDIIQDIELFVNNQLPAHTADFLKSLKFMSNDELIKLGPMQTNCEFLITFFLFLTRVR